MFNSDGAENVRDGDGVSESNVKGDWRRLPDSGFCAIYDRFPNNPFAMLPQEYIQKRWPSSRALLNAARHWIRYGYSATLPADVYTAVDMEGLGEELEELRTVFNDSWAAKTKGWCE